MITTQKKDSAKFIANKVKEAMAEQRRLNEVKESVRKYLNGRSIKITWRKILSK